MKENKYLIFEALMAAALIGLNAAFLGDYAVWAIVMKAVTSLFFVLAGICGYRKDKGKSIFSRLMLIAFLCCMAGDVLLALDSSGILFVIGVVGFAGAHILFSIAFSRVSPVKKADIIAMAVLFAGSTLLLCLGNFDFQGLLPVLILYAAIISFMVIKALSLWRCREGRAVGIKLIMAGGVFFILSDFLLLFWLFAVDMPRSVQCVNWVLYYLAQGCLTAALNVGLEN